MNYLSKLDGFSITDKDQENVNNEMKTLSIQLIMETAKDQRKGLFEAPVVDPDDPDLQLSTEVERKLDWETQIETLNLSHKQITIIKNLDLFVNLRKLNLMDNNIAKIQGLESCKLLEELSLEKNKIKTIENILHLKYLRKLDLGQNRI